MAALNEYNSIKFEEEQKLNNMDKSYNKTKNFINRNGNEIIIYINAHGNNPRISIKTNRQKLLVTGIKAGNKCFTNSNYNKTIEELTSKDLLHMKSTYRNSLIEQIILKNSCPNKDNRNYFIKTHKPKNESNESYCLRLHNKSIYTYTPSTEHIYTIHNKGNISDFYVLHSSVLEDIPYTTSYYGKIPSYKTNNDYHLFKSKYWLNKLNIPITNDSFYLSALINELRQKGYEFIHIVNLSCRPVHKTNNETNENIARNIRVITGTEKQIENYNQQSNIPQPRPKFVLKLSKLPSPNTSQATPKIVLKFPNPSFNRQSNRNNLNNGKPKTKKRRTKAN